MSTPRAVQAPEQGVRVDLPLGSKNMGALMRFADTRHLKPNRVVADALGLSAAEVELIGAPGVGGMNIRIPPATATHLRKLGNHEGTGLGEVIKDKVVEHIK